MKILYTVGFLVVIVIDWWVAESLKRLYITKKGAEEKEIKWITPVFLSGLCLAELIVCFGYLVFHERTATPSPFLLQQTVSPEPVPTTSTSLPFSSAPSKEVPVSENIPYVPPREMPQISSVRIVGYAERRQEMSEEIDQQRKAVEKLYALSEELKRKVYIIPDDSFIEGLPDESKREKVLPESIKPDSAKLAKARELDRQRHADEVKKQEEREVVTNRRQRYSRRAIEADDRQPDRKIIREVAPDEIQHQALSDSTMLCNEMQRQIDAKIRNQALFNNPIGQPTFLKGPRGILIITPEARKGNCIEYDIQIGEGNNPAHCRNTACMSLQ